MTLDQVSFSPNPIFSPSLSLKFYSCSIYVFLVVSTLVFHASALQYSPCIVAIYVI